jgi:hypothetical protein
MCVSILQPTNLDKVYIKIMPPNICHDSRSLYLDVLMKYYKNDIEKKLDNTKFIDGYYDIGVVVISYPLSESSL